MKKADTMSEKTEVKTCLWALRDEELNRAAAKNTKVTGGKENG